MLNQLNTILILLEDAIDTENWDLVRQATNKLEELYERIEIENDLGDSYEE
jgi:hypothetical protein